MATRAYKSYTLLNGKTCGYVFAWCMAIGIYIVSSYSTIKAFTSKTIKTGETMHLCDSTSLPLGIER